MTESEAIRENYNLGVMAGEAREQQRIIKLLEKQPCDTKAGHPYECNCEGFETAIALIKGETK